MISAGGKSANSSLLLPVSSYSPRSVPPPYQSVVIGGAARTQVKNLMMIAQLQVLRLAAGNLPFTRQLRRRRLVSFIYNFVWQDSHHRRKETKNVRIDKQAPSCLVTRIRLIFFSRTAVGYLGVVYWAQGRRKTCLDEILRIFHGQSPK